MSFSTIFVAFLYSFYLISSTIAEDCKIINPCKCEFENGTGIDLMPLNSTVKTTILPDQRDTTFYFNACGSGSKTNLPNNHNGTSCDDGFSVCAFNATSGETNRMASRDETSFRTSPSKTEKYLVFTNKDKKEILVSLVCVDIKESYIVVVKTAGLEDDSIILPNFILYSPFACMQLLENKSSLGTGSLLVILFFTGVLCYLFLGSLVNYVLLGARGVEVLPQLDFWRGLPSLVRDGAIFLQNGCRVTNNIRTSASNQESYDAI